MAIQRLKHAVKTKSFKAGLLAAALLMAMGGLLARPVYGHGDPCNDGLPDAYVRVQPGDKAIGELQAVLDGSNSVACNGNTIVDYAWDFGDGTTGNGISVAHTYPVGTYMPTLTITDSQGTTSTSSHTSVIVKASNVAPVLTDASATVLQGASQVIDVSANGTDADGDDITHGYYLPEDTEWGSNVTTAKGSVHRDADTGLFLYTAQSSATGTDTFQVGVRDGFGGEATATVTVDITPYVTAVADTASTQQETDVVINVTANDTSYQNEPFEIYWTSLSNVGGYVVSVDKPAGTITFRPDPGFVGTAQFEYGIKSLVPNVFSVSKALVTVEVLPRPNQAPVTTNDLLNLDEDTSANLNVLANDSDPDGDTLSTSLVSGPQHGIAQLAANGTLQYTPNANYFGTDTITYQITDTHGATATAVVSVNVASVNDTPVASFGWTNQGSGNIAFNASASSDLDNQIVSYHWNFGDGAVQTTTAPTVTHKYKGKTSRQVILTVTDASGVSATSTSTVTP